MSTTFVASKSLFFVFAVIVSSWVDKANAQVPLNGDQAAARKMFAALVQEKAIVERESRRDEVLAHRALHFMKARERFSSVRNFIEREIGTIFD